MTLDQRIKEIKERMEKASHKNENHTSKDNFKFIAHSRNDIEFLISQVEKLNKALKIAITALDKYKTQSSSVTENMMTARDSLKEIEDLIK